MKYQGIGAAGAFAAALLIGAGADAAPAEGAAAWPTKPLRFVVSFPPGTPGDQIIRLIQPALQQALGQPVVVDNKPGAGGNIGMREVVSATDGHTALVGPDTMMTINPYLYRKLSFKPMEDLRPVTLLATTSQLLVCNSSVPASNLGDLLALAKRSPMSYASGGPGVPGHMTMEMLLSDVKVKMEHVPYRGPAPAMQDVIAGAVPCGFLASSTVMPMVKEGRLKALASSGSTRLYSFPQVPTVAEAADPGFAANFGEIVAMPKGTPTEHIQKLYNEISKALSNPSVRSALSSLDLDLIASEPDTAAARLKTESTKWGAVASRINLQLD